MKINWFTPLPPAKTGIAYYSASLLPHLQKHADVTVWTEQDAWDSSLNRFAEIRRFKSSHLNNQQIDWPAVNRADFSIFHIGNNADFHSAIWEVSQKHSGIVVLHDFRLQHFFVHVYGIRYSQAYLYTDKMESTYGPEAGRRAAAYWRGEISVDALAETYPLTGLAVENSIAAVVHSPEPLQSLEAEGYGPILCLPLPYDATQKYKPRTENERGTVRLGVSGVLGTNRRLESIIQALGGLPEKGRFHLEIHGPILNEHEISQLIKSHGLEGQVSLYATPPAKLDEALSSIDLAFNLRNPTMGEASISQLQWWNLGIPTFITPHGWYATLPKDAVIPIHPDREISDIQHHLRQWLANPAFYRAIGRRGREILEQWPTPEYYSRRLVEFLNQTRTKGRRPIANYLADRVAVELKAWLPPSGFDLIADRLSEEIAIVSGARKDDPWS